MSGRVHPGKPELLWELLYWFWGSQDSVGVTQALQREHSAGFLKQRYRWINQFLEKSEGPRSRRSRCCPCMPRQSEEQSRWVSCPWFGTNMWVFLGIPSFLNLGIFCSHVISCPGGLGHRAGSTLLSLRIWWDFRLSLEPTRVRFSLGSWLRKN